MQLITVTLSLVLILINLISLALCDQELRGSSRQDRLRCDPVPKYVADIIGTFHEVAYAMRKQDVAMNHMMERVEASSGKSWRECQGYKGGFGIFKVR